MNKSWYRAYRRALSALVRGQSDRLSPADMVTKAGVIADASEAYLTKRGEEEDAADEAKRQAWEKEATEKVLRIGRYSIGGLGGPGDPRIILTVREVRGGRVYFHDNLRQIESADLADVDMEDGFVPAPTEAAEPAGDAVSSPHIPHAFVAGNGGAGGTASPNPMAGGSSNGQGPHGVKREPQR